MEKKKETLHPPNSPQPEKGGDGNEVRGRRQHNSYPQKAQLPGSALMHSFTDCENQR